MEETTLIEPTTINSISYNKKIHFPPKIPPLIDDQPEIDVEQSPTNSIEQFE